MTLRLALILLVSLVIGSTAPAGDNPTDAPDVDFSVYRTYAWARGTSAANEWVEEYIVKNVEGYLEAAGLRKVEGGEADLHVISTVVTNSVADYWTVFTRGTLVVELREPASQRVLWSGSGKAQIDEGNWAQQSKEHIKKKIDKITRKMFRGFPPG